MQRMDNIIPIPFDDIGESSIEILFVSGDKVQICGTGAKLVLSPNFSDWSPDVLSLTVRPVGT
jgi:hypothetical protein